MKPLVTDQIWNRAALKRGGPSPGVGDSALSALLLIHGATMNGGLDDAIDSLSSSEVTAGIDGFRYFGLSEVADLLERATTADTDELESLDEKYSKLVPDDNTLVQAFKVRFNQSQDSFSPLPP